jgi:hypothetical protein
MPVGPKCNRMVKVKMPFSRRFAYILLQSFRTPFTIAITPKRRRRGATVQRSGGGAHHNRDPLKQGRFFIMH